MFLWETTAIAILDPEHAGNIKWFALGLVVVQFAALGLVIGGSYLWDRL